MATLRWNPASKRITYHQVTCLTFRNHEEQIQIPKKSRQYLECRYFGAENLRVLIMAYGVEVLRLRKLESQKNAARITSSVIPLRNAPENDFVRTKTSIMFSSRKVFIPRAKISSFIHPS
ncbi:hypothetical protein AVEN_217144-1 [Araneus ventricosus]|uniref:Uncharacterized protein n=1 Tax=Araneus ventricosus TaxID=182803 RepID=A0A4Y2WRD9_ARAVE|nr:hypothetical protein AVEN_110079-1 [Araneus ventricosus]GBO39278.1 hypothetical protein AVEN_185135-1 [Araneus ventricosus]GBO39279.1 hypothetical protein AVEN_216116-1 [Araneus ventricosus]GBO39282.1 hypothetical protein AVEN_217144-1 [Araneus ventricosus]